MARKPDWGSSIFRYEEDDHVLQLAQFNPRTELPRSWRAFKMERAQLVHDVHMVLPVQLEVEVDAKVLHDVRGIYSIVESTRGSRANVGKTWGGSMCLYDEYYLGLVDAASHGSLYSLSGGTL